MTNFIISSKSQIMKTVRILPEQELHKYWAAYLNMARHNLFTTLTYIGQLTGIQRHEKVQTQKGYTLNADNEEEIHMMAVLIDTPAPEKEKRLGELMLHHFPFLRYTTIPDKDCEESYEPTLNEMRKALTCMARVMNLYRNRYSHGPRSWEVLSFNHDRMIKERGRERICGRMLTALTTASVRTIKERYKAGKNKTQEGMIDENSFKFITNRRVDMKTRSYDYKHFLYPVRQDPSLQDNEGRKCLMMTPVGLMQLTCLFLQKKYANEFLTQSHFLDAFEQSAVAPKLPERRLISEVMTALSMRMPESKLSMKSDSVQVALDTLNEIRKCPKELFDLLSDKDRREFMTIASDGSPVLLRRSGDRFPELAMKLMDVTETFPSLRFHVNTGTFRFLFNEHKICIDGKERVRILQKPVNCFGRLHEVEKMRQDCLNAGAGTLFSGTPVLTLEQSAGQETGIFPYITDTYSRYFIDGDNIAMSFGDRPASFGQNASGKPSVDNPIPDIWMSRHSLQGMLFLSILSGGQAVEDVIREAVEAFHKLFTDIAEGKLTPDTVAEASTDAASYIFVNYGIRKADIPEKIINYLSEEKVSSRFTEYKETLVKSMINDSESRLKRLECDLISAKSPDNKPGKKSFVQIRPGKLAGDIAKDIVLLQRESPQRKMTGLNYSIMQGAIATFSRENAGTKSDLLSMFTKAGLVGKNCTQGTHPFLHEVMLDSKTEDTVSFYISYHQHRLSFLKADVDSGEPFLHKESGRWAERDASYYRLQAEQYLSRPVCLPRTIFEDPIRQILMSYDGKGAAELHEAIGTALNDTGRCNTAFMAISYFDCCLEDGAQPFYGFFEGDMNHDNGYRFFDTVRNHPKAAKMLLERLDKDSVFFKELSRTVALGHKEGPNSKKPCVSTLSIDEEIDIIHRDFKKLTKTEKALRRYSVQDQMLFLAAKKVIEGVVRIPEGTEGIKLSDIGLKKSPALNSTISFDADIRLSKGAHSSIHVENIKLKDSGDISKLLNDSRVQSILEYHKNETVNASDLSKELEKYDETRSDVFGRVLEYENKILDGFSWEDIQLSLRQMGSAHVDFKFVLALDKLNNEASKTTLRVIRNAFSHNSYPRAEEKTAEKNTVRIHDGSIPGTASTISKKAIDIADSTPDKNSRSM